MQQWRYPPTMCGMPQPLISIIIPVRNEEGCLHTCLDSIESAAKRLSSSIEIIVVINRCTDRSEEIARQRNCRIVHDDSKNLSKIRNSGAKAASGEILVTVDADSRVSQNMLQEVCRRVADPLVIGGGVLIIPERWSMGIFLTALCLLPIIVWHGISGGLFFCRREDFNAIGGFNESLVSAEDIDFARRLKAFGSKTRRRYITLYRAHIVSSCRKFDRLGDWYFLRHPSLFLTLLQGRNQAAADRIWYDFER